MIRCLCDVCGGDRLWPSADAYLDHVEEVDAGVRLVVVEGDAGTVDSDGMAQVWSIGVLASQRRHPSVGDRRRPSVTRWPAW